jgi:ribonucleoside-diphosphate reductase alpha chain
VPAELLDAAQQAWDEAVELGERHGVRNSQASVLAPTGTIGLLMDCDTTGIEPDLGLVKTRSWSAAARCRSSTRRCRARCQARLRDRGGRGDRGLHRRAQVDRRARRGSSPSTCRSSPARWATTPSTTSGTSDDGRGPAVHLGRDLQDGEHARGRHRRGRRAAPHRRLALGVKAVAIYRDNCKVGPAALDHEEGRRGVLGDRSPRPTRSPSRAARAHEKHRRARGGAGGGPRGPRTVVVVGAVRERLPRRRNSTTFAFRVADCEGYVTVGEYEDGRPGRGLHQGLQAGFDPGRDHGRLLDLDQPRPAARRAAGDLRAQVREHEVRAGGHHRRPDLRIATSWSTTSSAGWRSTT